MARAGIALGSNLGDRLAHLRGAFEHLCRLAVPGEPVIAGPVYQTVPRFCPPDSPDFLNTVVEIAFDGSPRELLERTRAIETLMGRAPRSERNAPRLIDIDLLYMGDATWADADLVLPHPRMVERRFVLQPLADIRPGLVLPGEVADVASLLAALVSDEPPLDFVDWLVPPSAPRCP